MINTKPDIPVTWIEKQIKHSSGMEHAMWQKLLRRWENEQVRKITGSSFMFIQSVIFAHKHTDNDECKPYKYYQACVII